MMKETIEQYLLFTSLNRINDNLSKHMEKSFRKSILTKAQFSVLLTMAFLIEYEKSPIKITDLVPYNNGNLSNISSLVHRMGKKGLIKKKRDEADQRIVCINLTPKGQKALKKSVRPIAEKIRELFSVYSKEEVVSLTSLLNKLSLSMEIAPIRQKMYKRVPIENQVAYLNKLES